MAVFYELMDIDSANVVGHYDAKADALAIVRQSFERYGLAGIAGLAMSEKAGDGSGELIAEGQDLLRLAADAEVTARSAVALG